MRGPVLRNPDLLFFVATPAAAATLRAVAGWHLIRHRLSGRRHHRPGFSWCVVGTVTDSINAILLLLFIAAYLGDISAYGEILRIEGQH